MWQQGLQRRMRSKTWPKKIARILHIYITLRWFTSLLAEVSQTDLHARTKQACQHNYKPTLHKFLKIIKEWLLVEKIIEALEQTYVAKQRHQLCSLSFQTLNTFPCRHPVLRVYHPRWPRGGQTAAKVIKNGKESRPGMLLLRNQFYDSLECRPPIGHKK